MKLDVSLTGIGTRQAVAIARDAEARGFDGVWTSESVGDGLIMSMGAALATSTIDVASAVVVALARNPMSTAYAAWDLAAASDGRFALGIGTQTRAHIERRFSMPWSSPVDRIVDFVGALRAIWRSWQDGTPLDYAGAYYRHDLMTPMFTPAHHEYPLRVYGSAVGPRMTAAVGQHFDGFVGHPFVTPTYFDAVIAPALSAARADTARAFTVFSPLMLLMGDSDRDVDAARVQARKQIAFYGSTREYVGVLKSVGREDLQPELHRLSKQRKWDVMSELIDDDLLDAMTIAGTPEQVITRVGQRWGSRLDRISSIFGWPANLDPDRVRHLLAEESP